MIKDKVLETIRKYNLINEGDKIVLGVSGGPDSIAMLYILNEFSKILNFKIYVAHVNHGIRKEAEEDELYVKEICEKFGVEFFVLHINVEKEATLQKLGVEETGRKIRYDFFDEILRKVDANKIAVAHNKNDKAETIIMNVMRGSGSRGLCGIDAIQRNIIRPLIEISRKEIEEFCNEQKLEPRIDKTNFENDYTRNKIRNIVIPYIEKEFNPKIVDSLERLSEIMREQEEYIQEETEKQYKNIVISEIKNDEDEYNIIVLNLKNFNNLPIIIEKKISLFIKIKEI